MKSICAMCTWYNPDPNGQPAGECRVRSPRVVWAIMAPGGVQSISAFPIVSQDRWCGEFKSRITLVEPPKPNSGAGGEYQ